MCVWFTRLSGSGKGIIAKSLQKRLFDEGKSVLVFDRENLRHGLNVDLGFSRADRREDIRRIGHVARLMYDFRHIGCASS